MAGPSMPFTYVASGHRIFDWSGLTEAKQILSLVDIETLGIPPEQDAIIILERAHKVMRRDSYQDGLKLNV